MQTVLYIIQEVVHEEVTVVSRNRHETTVWSGLHLFDESFPLQGDRRDEQLRLIQQRGYGVRKALREALHLSDFVDHDQPRLSMPDVKFS